jgi:glutamate carboxypeptidase
MTPRQFPQVFLCCALLLGFLALPCSTIAAARNEGVLAKAENAKADAILLLEKLVNIDTGTGQNQGLDQMGEILAAELTKLGAQIERVSAAPMAGQNLVATFTGTGKGKILLIAHMDTVFKPGTAAERPFRITEGKAYGPGVCDDKGGIVLGLTALRIIGELDFKDFGTITLMLNTNEEVGSLGSRRLIESLARKHDVALNLEAGRVGDKLVSWRKGSASIELTVKGRASHAGNTPEKGINAALELAHQSLQLAKLANPALLTTVNLTVLQSGDRTNVIPDLAVAKADVRAVTEEEFSRLEKDLAVLVQNKLIAETEVNAKLNRSFPPMSRNAATDALVARTQEIYTELGRTLGTEGAGGAADSSLTAGVGTPSLDGLGPIGGGGHSPEEFLELDSFVPRTYLLTRLLMELGRGQ